MEASQRTELSALLARAGLPAEDIWSWLEGHPRLAGDLARDGASCARFWEMGAALLARLPPKPARGEAEQAATNAILQLDREIREAFLVAHAETVYRRLTDDLRNFVRVERLIYDAANLVPGLTPSEAAVARENAKRLSDKDGIEIDQGLFVSRVLAHPETGCHLCHAMLLPRPEAHERLAHFIEHGAADLGAATIRRSGKSSLVALRHPRFLNAEDDTTIDALETAVDLALLDPGTELTVLRGDVVDQAKYRGKRVFCAGINLTHLYYGKIPFIWYLERDLGIVNKIYRGVATPDALPDDVVGTTIEKPWIAAIDAFAIGGGCQYLLVMDYVLAARDAYMTLPARKEGIIPGAANLRLPRFTGDRIARQAILAEKRLDCDSPEGRLICDEIVAPEAMDAAITRVVAALTSSGVVSAAGNRRALRVAQEPFDLFRSYMAVYAREQAFCHFSPQLVANLERHWNAKERRA